VKLEATVNAWRIRWRRNQPKNRILILANAAEAIEGKERIGISARNGAVSTEFEKLTSTLTQIVLSVSRLKMTAKGCAARREKEYLTFFTTKFQGRGPGMAAV
jgi:hypothetical protein